MISRRSFLRSSIIFTAGVTVGTNPFLQRPQQIMTVTGPIGINSMGHSLIHEHILVDFIGAEQYDPKRWNRKDVIEKIMPHLRGLKATGCKTLVDCTPNYLGRDVELLRELSKLSDLQILTNTGYYGGSANKFLPAHAFTETEQQLADRWVKEFNIGIDGTNIRPGFIKISVNDGSLSEISRKLIRAAGLCHLQTGLTIASHTGPAVPAMEEIEILKQMKVSPGAFIWVHAQNEKDWNQYLIAGRQGAWVSLDGLGDENVTTYVEMLAFLKKGKLLHQVLLSHDAGWYEPGKPDGGKIRGYTTLSIKLLPALKQAGFSVKEIAQLIKDNPAKAFALRVKKID